MHSFPRLLLGLCLVGILLGAGCASAPVAPTGESTATLLLWPEGAPGAKGTAPTDQPRIDVYLPPKGAANGTAVVVCPGGGYMMLAKDLEGVQVAHWLNKLGVTAFVLTYRLGSNGYHYPIETLDGQRAMRLVRSRAEEWNINPDRIGIMGFSAGGHLASTVGTHFDPGIPSSQDSVERVSSRPDFMILIYPVISMKEGITHQGSRNALLGPNPDPSLVTLLSNETQVTAKTPPTFLAVGGEDTVVRPINSMLFWQACDAKKVPAELHIFQKGEHGFGLGLKSKDPLNQWPKLCADWLASDGWIKLPAEAK